MMVQSCLISTATIASTILLLNSLLLRSKCIVAPADIALHGYYIAIGAASRTVLVWIATMSDLVQRRGGGGMVNYTRD